MAEFLTPHFTLEELTFSETALRKGINNKPSVDVLDALYTTAEGLERVRTALGVPIVVVSGYRSPKLNAAVGGAKTSQHVTGYAADFHPLGLDLADACETLIDHEDFVNFDQLILEGGESGWIHVSFAEHPRREVLTASFVNGKAQYSKGLV